VNGWQSYGTFNEAPGFGTQLLWRPTGSLSILANQYFGKDTLGRPGRSRFHSDNSIQYKYHDNLNNTVSKAAFSLTVDAGCESGDGVSCFSGDAQSPAQYFLGIMAYNRFWLSQDRFAITLGAGAISNPGRYLVLLPPINGATASTGSPYFTLNSGDDFHAWDSSITFDYMPSQSITFRIEYIHRESNVPYFSGSGGMTPSGGNTNTPATAISDWQPDLSKAENRINTSLMIRL
jgi:hypothetical protein